MPLSKEATTLVPGSRPLEDIARQRNVSIDTLIREALSTGGSITGAARVLGVNRNTVRHHMKRMGIQVEIRYHAQILEGESL